MWFFFLLLLSDVACDHVLEMHIQQHDAETRTLGHNNAEVVLRFCLPKLTAAVNSSYVGPFLFLPLSDVACDLVLEMHIQQHDAETRTLGHNNAEVVLRFCLPKLTAAVNSSCVGPFLFLPLSDVACDLVLEMHIQQHDAETRTLGHNNAEVVLRFCLPKLTAAVNSFCVGTFLCFCRMLHVTMSWKCSFSSMMQRQGPSDTAMPKLYLDSAYQS